MSDEFVVALYTSAAVPETSTPALTLDEPMLLVKAHDSGWLEVLTVDGSTGFVPPAWVRPIRPDELRAAAQAFVKEAAATRISTKQEIATEFGFGDDGVGDETTTTTRTAAADNGDDDDDKSNATLQQQRQRQQAEQEAKYNSRPTSLEIEKPSFLLPPPPPDDEILPEPTRSPRPTRAAPPAPNADGDATKKPQRNAPPPPAGRQKSVLDTTSLLNPQQLQQMGRPAPKPPRPEPPRPEPPRLPVRTDAKSSERPDIVPTVERAASTGKKPDDVASAIPRTGSTSMPQPGPTQPSESEPATVC